MGDYHHKVIGNALHSPPSSPTKTRPTKTSSPNNEPATPLITPVAPSKKRPAPSPSDSFENERPSHRQRIDSSADGNKLDFGEGGSRSAPLDGLAANMEQMVKMLRRVGATKGLISDPVMACLLSAQTVVMACTAELISRTAPPGQQSKASFSSINRAANGAVEKKNIKRPELKK